MGRLTTGTMARKVTRTALEKHAPLTDADGILMARCARNPNQMCSTTSTNCDRKSLSFRNLTSVSDNTQTGRATPASTA